MTEAVDAALPPVTRSHHWSIPLVVDYTSGPRSTCQDIDRHEHARSEHDQPEPASMATPVRPVGHHVRIIRTPSRDAADPMTDIDIRAISDGAFVARPAYFGAVDDGSHPEL